MPSGIFSKNTGYHNRQSVRLRGYDYSQPGYYFITICTRNRKRRLFGDIKNGKMILSELGMIAHNQFACLPERFPNIKLDVYQIMPDHMHAIIPIRAILARPVRATLTVARCPGDLVGSDIPKEQMVVSSYGAGASPARTENDGIRTENDGIRTENDGIRTENDGVSSAGTDGDELTGISLPAADCMRKVTVGDIVGAYKSIVANECLKIYKSKNERMGKLWHRNYYDRIVRDRIALFTISNYIRNNPVRWHDDTEHHIDKEIDEWEMVEVKCDS